MDPVTISLALQAAGLLKGGAGGGSAPAPNVSASNGNFSNQLQQFGLPGWSVNLGGSGPDESLAFSGNNRPDSLVMGLTGQSTTAAASIGLGNGMGLNLGSGGSGTIVLLVGAAILAVLIFKK